METLDEAVLSHVVESKLKHSDFSVGRYTLEPLQTRNYFLLRVSVTILQENESERTDLSFWVKRCGAKEAFVYKSLKGFVDSGINYVEQCVLKCFQYENLLVFEECRSYRFLQNSTTFDYDAIIIVLRSIAKLHASSLIYQERNSEFSEQPQQEKEDIKDFKSSLKCLLQLIDYFNHNCGSTFKLLVNEFCHKKFDLIKPSKIHKNVLSHCELSSCNILLSETDCKFINFENAKFVPPAQDLMSFLHLAVTRELRKCHFYEFVGIYYATLEKLMKLAGYDLKEIIGFEDYLESCEEQKLFGVVQAGLKLPWLLLGGKEEKSFEVIVEACSKDEKYRKRLEDAVLDLQDYCEYL